MSSLCPTYLGWEYPVELGTNQGFNNVDLDSVFLLNFSSSQSQEYNYQLYDHVKRSESPQDTSSTDHQFDINPMLSKKLSHNASERVRRKKISNLYSSLRALLPSADQKMGGSYTLKFENLNEELMSLLKVQKQMQVYC
uniref:BHLH domain-containing protein n=1 Tax=Chenopodium quinoa TaxID=63459 RepID=A0A803MM25_CHEQI